MKLWAAALAATMSVPAHAADLAVAPGDSIVALPAGGRGYYDLLVPTVMVRAGDGERLKDLRLTLSLIRAGQAVLTRNFSSEELVGDTAGLGEARVPGFVNGQALSPDGLSGLFGKPTVLATSAELTAGQAMGAFASDFVTRGPVDSVRVTAEATDADGKPVRLQRMVPVSPHKSPIDYRSPLKGQWLMTVLPSLKSHHRFNPPSEFAVDFFKAGPDGKIWHDSSDLAANFYGFGADVLAAADGVVVTVLDGDVQDRAMLMRKPGETPQAAGQRIQSYNMSRYARDFARAAAGNLVVIRHEQGGVVEYSAYGHLEAGIPVKVGQAVKQGQPVGKVGDTGDSAAVHLHFQLNAGPDPFTSKSLPVRFADIRDPTGIDDVLELVSAG
jgi:hypothetical protein